MKSWVVFVLVVLMVGVVSADVDLSSGYWETTFDCEEWQESEIMDWFTSFNCDEIGLGKGETFIGTEITSAANFQEGEGGRGMRFWKGDGANQGSTIARIDFNDYQKEFWVRWYMRYEEGFTWDPFNYDKLIYLYTSPGSGGTAVGGIGLGESAGVGEIYAWSNFPSAAWAGSDSTPVIPNVGFNDIWGGGSGVSDGSWHYIEAHFVMDSSDAAGVAQVWVDGELKANTESAYWSNGVALVQEEGFTGFMFDHNQRDPGNGRNMYVDWDDMAVSTTGYIGPVGELVSVCGDSVCEGGENCSSCAEDCGVCGSVCGNGVVESGEDCDDGNTITEECFYGLSSCVVCSSGCLDVAGATSYCGDGSCDSLNEDGGSCLGDCAEENGSVPEGVLFFEGFEDTSFASRDWYDNTNLVISGAESVVGSSSSLEFHWDAGDTAPDSGGSIRHLFSETESVYVDYWVKYSSNWEGSNRAYHPHEFLIMTNKDSDWTGPAYAHLTAYIEQNEGAPLLAIQDGRNVDELNIGVDLVGVSEDRGVAGCNGDSDGYGDGSCYVAGENHWNGKQWKAGNIYFQDNLGDYYKNDWHHVGAYFELNSVVGGVGQNDGVLKYWYDGELIIDYEDVVMRTGENFDMKFNQFLIGPWIGDGSPVDQTFWVDNLTVATGYVSGEACVPVEEICGDGVDQDCDGEDLACVCAHDADLDCDGVVSVGELGDYIGLWLVGGKTIGEVMGAIGVWGRG